MRTRVFLAFCLFAILLTSQGTSLVAQAPPPAQPAAPSGSAPEGKQPSIITQDIFSDADNKSYLGSWMSYDSKAQGKSGIPWVGSKVGDEPTTIYPNPQLSGFGDSMCALQAGLCVKSERDLFLIHVIDWTASNDQLAIDPKTKDVAKPPIMALVNSVAYANSYWYFYQRDSKGNFHSIQPKIDKKDGSYTLPNIYDVDNGYVISISRLTTTSTEINLVPPSVSYTATATSSLPNWLTGLETIVSKMTGVTIPSTSPGGGGGGGGAGAAAIRTDQYHKVFIKIQELSASPVKRPFTLAVSATASARPLSDADKLAVANYAKAAPADNVASSPPSQLDCSILNPQSNCSFQASAAVQARDFVLFGIGVVPHGPSETDYTTNSSGVQSSTTSARNNFYGLVDFTPCPVRCTMKNWPYLQVGLPLTGAAWHAPYAGVGVPIPWPWLKKTIPLSAFVGTIVLKQKTASGTTNTNPRLLWGIEVPLSSLASQIQSVTGKKKSGGGGG